MVKKLLLLSLIFSFTLPGLMEGSNIKFFAPGNFYVYTMASSFYIDPLPEEPGWGKDSRFGPTFGIGYRFMHFSRRALLNFEFDYSAANFNLYRAKRNVNFYSFKVGFEYNFLKRQLVSAYTNIGFTHIIYLGNRYYQELDEGMVVVDIGLKFNFNRKLNLRAEFRILSDPGDSRGYYYDDYYCCGSDGISITATAFSLGLEYTF